MMTSKERAELRAQANPLDVTLIVGKGGISDTLLDEAVVLLDSHELVKGRVLETSGLTARSEMCIRDSYNPVKAGLRARKQAAEQQRKQRKQYFHDKAVSAAIERSRQQKEEQ